MILIDKNQMIIRDVNGNLHIINRNDCKNDTVYYQKIFNIRKDYMTKYKSIVFNSNSFLVNKKEQSK